MTSGSVLDNMDGCDRSKESTIVEQMAGKNEIYHVTLPRTHKAFIALWRDMSYQNITDILLIESSFETRQYLADLFELRQEVVSDMERFRNEILLDLYCNTLQYASQNQYSAEQTSVLFSVVKSLHEIATESPFGNVNECWAFVKEMLLIHSVRRPPFSLDIFDKNKAKEIADYLLNSYFRHFKMYKYAFTPAVRLDLNLRYNREPEPVSTAPSAPISRTGTSRGTTAKDLATPRLDSADVEQHKLAEDSATLGIDDSRHPDDIQEAEEPFDDASVAAYGELSKVVEKSLAKELSKLRVELEGELNETEERLILQMKTASGAAGDDAGTGGKKKKKK